MVGVVALHIDGSQRLMQAFADQVSGKDAVDLEDRRGKRGRLSLELVFQSTYRTYLIIRGCCRQRDAPL